MATIGKVRAVFEASTSGLTAGVSKAVASLQRVEKSSRAAAGGVRMLAAFEGAKMFASVASSAVGYVSSLASMGLAQGEIIDQQSKLAARLGMSMSEFSGIALAADLSGVSMDNVAAAATKADVAFVKAQQGSDAARAAFERIGLSVEELEGMSPADRFKAISSAISSMPSAAERAAASVALFGKSGTELLPMFAGGAGAIEEAAAQAERMGLALTNAQGQDVEAMNDSFTLVSKTIGGIIGQVTAYLAPAVTAIANTFTNLVGNVGGATIGQAIGDGILQGAEFFAGVADWFVSAFTAAWEYVGVLAGVWNVVVSLLQRAASFLYGVFQFFQAVGAGVGAVIMKAASYFSKEAGYAADQYARSAAESLKASKESIGAAFSSEGPKLANATKGPMATAIGDAIAKAKASAGAKDEPSGAPPPAAPPAAAAAAAVEPQQLKGIDSRSSEGVAEMMRLARGGGDVQQEQLRVLERIHEAIGDEDDAVLDLAY